MVVNPLRVRPVPRAPAVCANKPLRIWLKVPEKWPNCHLSKELLQATIGNEEYTSPITPLFFQLTFVTLWVRVVPFNGEPVCVPVSSSHSKVAAIISRNSPGDYSSANR